jgi:hypothetical protein
MKRLIIAVVLLILGCDNSPRVVIGVIKENTPPTIEIDARGGVTLHYYNREKTNAENIEWISVR